MTDHYCPCTLPHVSNPTAAFKTMRPCGGREGGTDRFKNRDQMRLFALSYLVERVTARLLHAAPREHQFAFFCIHTPYYFYYLPLSLHFTRVQHNHVSLLALLFPKFNSASTMSVFVMCARALPTSFVVLSILETFISFTVQYWSLYCLYMHCVNLTNVYCPPHHLLMPSFA